MPCTMEPSLKSFEEEVAQLLRYDETLRDVLIRRDREQLRSGIHFVDSAVTLRPGVLLEIVGSHGSGKSELLLQVKQSTRPPHLVVLGTVLLTVGFLPLLPLPEYHSRR